MGGESTAGQRGLDITAMSNKYDGGVFAFSALDGFYEFVTGYGMPLCYSLNKDNAP
jgi:hypothetical protein